MPRSHSDFFRAKKSSSTFPSRPPSEFLRSAQPVALRCDGCGVHRCGNSSSIRLAGCVCTRSSTSARYASGLTSLASHDPTSEYSIAVCCRASAWPTTRRFSRLAECPRQLGVPRSARACTEFAGHPARLEPAAFDVGRFVHEAVARTRTAISWALRSWGPHSQRVPWAFADPDHRLKSPLGAIRAGSSALQAPTFR